MPPNPSACPHPVELVAGGWNVNGVIGGLDKRNHAARAAPKFTRREGKMRLIFRPELWRMRTRQMPKFIRLTPNKKPARNRAMRRNHSVLVFAALWLTAAVVTFAASAHLGTWKLNESKSDFAPGATKNHTVTYEQTGDMTKLTVDGTDKDGKAVHWTWTGKFDGKPYKVEGNPLFDTVAYKAVNEHTNKITGMKDGKVVFTGTIKVAKDGKSRMVTTTMADASGKKHTDKAYYDKE